MDALLAEELVSRAPGAETDRRRLVERAARGEPGAFGQLYRMHVDDVFNYVHFRVRDEAVAEDLTQDVFVSALKGIADLRQHDRFRHWLLRIAHNRVLNHWRGQSTRPETSDLAAATTPGGRVEPALQQAGFAEAVDRRLAGADVLAATDRLTDLQGQVIALRFVAGLSVAETAAVMGRSVNAVKNLQHHALAALRRHLATEGGGA